MIHTHVYIPIARLFDCIHASTLCFAYVVRFARNSNVVGRFLSIGLGGLSTAIASAVGGSVGTDRQRPRQRPGRLLRTAHSCCASSPLRGLAPSGFHRMTPPRLAALRAALALPADQVDRPRGVPLWRREAAPGGVSTFARESVQEGGNPRVLIRFPPCAVTPRTYRPSLRQDRTLPGYAVKALLARSVLAFGCAPHAACGVSLTAPGAVRPCLRGDRYTV